MSKSVLCLVSGGIDSTVLVKYYLDKGWDVKGLFVDHNQPMLSTEKKAVYSFPTDFIKVGSLWEVQSRDFVYDKFFGPVRNAFLLTLAINKAVSKGIRNVAIGVSHGEYLDTRPEFIDRFNFMLDFCIDKPPYVLAPFAHWSKERVIKYGLKIGAPLNLTFSCMEYPPCGKCQDCRLRRKYKIDPEEKNVSTG